MPRISVCIPCFKSEKTLGETLLSVKNQSFKDYEIVMVDGKPLYISLNELVKDSKSDILVFLSADDILLPNSLQNFWEKFQQNKQLGIIVRPYYWFKGDWRKPLRWTKQKDFRLWDLIFLTGQLSGIALRKSMIKCQFQQKTFVEFASVALPMIRDTDSIILEKPTVAIRIDSSEAKKKWVYEKSPFRNWCEIIEFTFSLNKELIDLLEKQMAKNYIGLVQIKKYGGQKALIREIREMLLARLENIFSIRFWFYCVFLLIAPSYFVCKISDLIMFKLKKT